MHVYQYRNAPEIVNLTGYGLSLALEIRSEGASATRWDGNRCRRTFGHTDTFTRTRPQDPVPESALIQGF